VAAIVFSDASIDGGVFVMHRPGGNGELRSPAGWRTLPGNHPAAGGGRLAYVTGATVQVEGGPAIPAPGANAVAVSAAWVAWRANGALYAASISDGLPSQLLAGDVGRPVLSANLLVYELGGRIESIDLTTGLRQVLRQERRAQLRGPSVLGSRLTYVRATYKRQQLMTGALLPRRTAADRTLYGTTPTARRDAGHEPGRGNARGHINKPLWVRPPKGVSDTLTTTAASADAIYFTRVRQPRRAPARADIIRVAL
jgi:hypothetical protein